MQSFDTATAAAASTLRALFPRANGGQGTNRNAQGSSLSALVSTLIPVLLVAVIVFIVFLIFQKSYERVYQPRSYLQSLRNWQRSPRQTAGLLGWSKEYRQLRDEFVLGHASIDNFLWLRFFRILTTTCLVGCFITWPILFPINATGSVKHITGLDVLSFSHIHPGPRYYAQALVAWAFLAWVMFVIWRESAFFIRLQQRYFLSPYQKARISSRTVLFVNVPEAARNEEHLRNEYAGVRQVWLVSVPEDLAKKVEERDKAAAKLENGEIKLIMNHVKRQMKKEKKGEAAAPPPANNADGSPGAIAVEKKDIPSHRLPILKFLPFGKKVVTVEWARNELHRLIPAVAQEQGELRNTPASVGGACFIEFESVGAAHQALMKTSLKSMAKMTPKETGMPPDDVIWGNIIKPFAKTKSFSILATTFVWLLCIFWAIPVAVVGAISNISYLEQKVPFLHFISNCPPVILGLITGLLPVILLAVLMALVPIIMTILAKMFEPTQGSVQMRVQGWYFPFQVIQVFLVTTFASGAAAVVTQIIKKPQTAPTLLASNLPKASNFYISFFVLFGLSTASMQFLNVVPLLFVMFLGKILDKTPRKMYNRYVNLAGVGWGAQYPKFTNLGVIALAYSCISPLILGFATVGFYLLYLGFRYNALFTLGTGASTRGESYARALQQLTVGIYLSEICLIGLFAIGVGSTNQAIGPLVLMFIFLVGTIAWHVLMNRHLKKLRADLPGEGGIDDILRQHQMQQHRDGVDGVDVERAPGAHNTYNNNNNGGAQAQYTPDGPMSEKPLPASPQEKQSMMTRIKAYFRPQTAAETAIASISPDLASPPRPYTPQEAADAYVHPAIHSDCPVVWLARDKYGLSTQEVWACKREVGEGLDVTDEHAWFDEKGNLQINKEDVEKAPVWEDEPAY